MRLEKKPQTIINRMVELLFRAYVWLLRAYILYYYAHAYVVLYMQNVRYYAHSDDIVLHIVFHFSLLYYIIII
jgi:hypothetical protein